MKLPAYENLMSLKMILIEEKISRRQKEIAKLVKEDNKKRMEVAR